MTRSERIDTLSYAVRPAVVAKYLGQLALVLAALSLVGRRVEEETVMRALVLIPLHPVTWWGRRMGLPAKKEDLL